MTLFWILFTIWASVGAIVLFVGLMIAYNSLAGGKFERAGARMALFFALWPLFLPYLAYLGLANVVKDLLRFADLSGKRSRPKTSDKRHTDW